MVSSGKLKTFTNTPSEKRSAAPIAHLIYHGNLQLALATQGGGLAADPPPKSFTLLVFYCFWGPGPERRG